MMDERQRILEMLQQGKVTVEEARRLLAAVEAPAPPPSPRLVRIRVVTRAGDTLAVNVPVALARWAVGVLPASARLVIGEQPVGLRDLVESIAGGAVTGKVVDAVGAGGDRVEISVE